MRLGGAAMLLLFAASGFAATAVYRNSFQDAPGTSYPEWTGGAYTYGPQPAGGATQKIVNAESPDGRERFLGEFGGPAVVKGPPFVKVDQSVRLSLERLGKHSTVTVSFDLLVLKSWDGNNGNYGPDRFQLSVAGGPVLLASTFSNNPKTGAYDLSTQDYPVPNSLPRTGAAAVNTLGYAFFGDSTYHLSFTFQHDAASLALDFASSLFEGKGTADESWGLDNVTVTLDAVPSEQG